MCLSQWQEQTRGLDEGVLTEFSPTVDGFMREFMQRDRYFAKVDDWDAFQIVKVDDASKKYLSAWELPAHQISASNYNSFDLNLRPTPQTRMSSRVTIPKITTVSFFPVRDHLWVSCLCVVLFWYFFVCFLYKSFSFLCVWNFFVFTLGKINFNVVLPHKKVNT